MQQHRSACRDMAEPHSLSNSPLPRWFGCNGRFSWSPISDSEGCRYRLLSIMKSRALGLPPPALCGRNLQNRKHGSAIWLPAACGRGTQQQYVQGCMLCCGSRRFHACPTRQQLPQAGLTSPGNRLTPFLSQKISACESSAYGARSRPGNCDLPPHAYNSVPGKLLGLAYMPLHGCMCSQTSKITPARRMHSRPESAQHASTSPAHAYQHVLRSATVQELPNRQSGPYQACVHR